MSLSRYNITTTRELQMANLITKTNVKRSKIEIKIANYANRLRQLGSSLTSTTSRKKPNTKFMAAYQSTLSSLEEEITDLRLSLIDLENHVDQQSRVDRFKKMAEVTADRFNKDPSSRVDPYNTNKNKQ
jgi:predicted  nucleic acid-binding Zn-ribbon protein